MITCLYYLTRRKPANIEPVAMENARSTFFIAALSCIHRKADEVSTACRLSFSASHPRLSSSPVSIPYVFLCFNILSPVHSLSMLCKTPLCSVHFYPTPCIHSPPFLSPVMFLSHYPFLVLSLLFAICLLLSSFTDSSSTTAYLLSIILIYTSFLPFRTTHVFYPISVPRLFSSLAFSFYLCL